MKVERFDIGKLQLLCAVNPGAPKVAYILYPMDMPGGWIEDAANKYGISLVVITGFDWDNDLTPWPAPGQPKGSPDFKGNAPELLKTLTTGILPALDLRYGFPPAVERSLVGVSLSGLFTIWQWAICDVFENIATLSGSFWYEGFEQWVFRQSFSRKKGRCFMLLGSAEPHSAVPAFRKVGACTENIAGYLRRQGVDVTYTIVPGNHFQHPLPRLAAALAHL